MAVWNFAHRSPFTSWSWFFTEDNMHLPFSPWWLSFLLFKTIWPQWTNPSNTSGEWKGEVHSLFFAFVLSDKVHSCNAWILIFQTKFVMFVFFRCQCKSSPKIRKYWTYWRGLLAMTCTWAWGWIAMLCTIWTRSWKWATCWNWSPPLHANLEVTWGSSTKCLITVSRFRSLESW